MTMKATILYIPHGGGPLPLLDEPGHAAMNRFLRAFPATIGRPEAIVVISAHWEQPRVTITAAPAPPLLFDYYGFPAETYDYEYPARGNPGLAGRARDMLRKAGIEAALDAGRYSLHPDFPDRQPRRRGAPSHRQGVERVEKRQTVDSRLGIFIP
jgi:aromatic ring-opening dioxygenase catalytic subunit (LigB family)